MKATLEVEFADELQARQASLVVLSVKTSKAMLHVSHKLGKPGKKGKPGNAGKKGQKPNSSPARHTILYVIEAGSFPTLRAMTTSLMRDLRVFFAVAGAVGGKGEKG